MASVTDSMPAPATAPAATIEVESRKVRRYQLLGGLQVADVVTTWFLLARYTHKAEGNPVVATIIDHAGLELSMILLLAVKLLVVYALYKKQTGVNLMSALYGAVVFNNVLGVILALA